MTGPVKQAATVVFAFAASVSFLLVNVVDPYSGATATSTYVPVDRFGGEAAEVIFWPLTQLDMLIRPNYWRP